ncbi:hypothetical protein ACFYWH_11410 [Streptomyces sp. NPDC003737]
MSSTTKVAGVPTMDTTGTDSAYAPATPFRALSSPTLNVVTSAAIPFSRP